MKTISLRQFAEASGKALHLLSLLTDGDALQRWIDDPDRGIELTGGEDDRPAAEHITKKLLELVTSASIPALPQFIASDHFKEGMKGAVRIWCLGTNFKEKFLKKIEGATEEVDLKVHKLLKSSPDPAIMTELGKDAYGITLGQFFHLLAKQGEGEKTGSLLVNGFANVAHIQDVDGIFWAVCARWSAGRGGWYVAASPVEDPRDWAGGDQFLSR